MKIIKLRIDGQQFYLGADTDTDELKRQILETARGVAQFVDFHPVGHGVVSVLMTPQTPVHFEIEERTEAQLTVWETDPPAADVGSGAYEETPAFNLADDQPSAP
jgi:hypothetical protein